MSYFPSPDGAEAKEMLAKIGLDNVGQLFNSIPENLRTQAAINLPAGLSELELTRAFKTIASKNIPLTKTTSFIGAGIYPYPVYAAAMYAASRGEFLTAYTPYQPEISQGTLMAIFEFQTWMSELSGLPIANASMYDGATAFAEAILMGLRVRKKCKDVYLSTAIAPNVRQVINTYLAGQDVTIHLLAMAANGQTDFSQIKQHSTGKIIALSTPNSLGIIEDLEFIQTLKTQEDFLITHTPDPHAWLLLQPPGQFDVDVAVAEGQPFGITPSFGGPLLGIFTTKEAFLRQMPGRLCGQTVDQQGRRGFVLTLSTREQHIRREKATSNICTNQGVYALIATATLAVLGPQGLRKQALQSAHHARQLETLLNQFGFKRRHTAPYFNEFVIDAPMPTDKLNKTLLSEYVQLGLPLAKWDPSDTTGLLVCATAFHNNQHFEQLKTCLKKIL